MPGIAIIAPFQPQQQPPRLRANQTDSPEILLRPLPHPALGWVCLRKACMEVRAESFQLPKPDSLSDSLHHVKVKVEIVVGVQDDGEKFSRGIEVPQIRAGIPATHGAPAALVDGPRIIRVARIPNQQAPLRSKKASVARAARGENAIHHVYAQTNVVNDLFGLADTHQVARAIRRQA